MLFLKLQPYVQSSVARRAHHKLSFKFFGPFCVLERIVKVVYKLALPEGSTVHPIFHVSQLKSSSGDHTVSTDVPSELAVFQFLRKSYSAAGRLVIIQWSRSLSSGLICLLHWRPGRMLLISGNNFRWRQHGVMPLLKKGGVLASRLTRKHKPKTGRRAQGRADPESPVLVSTGQHGPTTSLRAWLAEGEDCFIYATRERKRGMEEDRIHFIPQFL
jgi:hypothetical protein